MSSAAENDDKLPADFIRCVEKLFSSVSTLSKHLTILIQQDATSQVKSETTSKLQVGKHAWFFLSLASGSGDEREAGKGCMLSSSQGLDIYLYIHRARIE